MATDLVALIREKQTQIAKLQAELAEARALLDGQAADLNASDPSAASPRSSSRKRRKRRPRQRALPIRTGGQTSVSMATAVLLEAKHPLHVNDILERIGKKFERQVLKDTLVGNLVRLANGDRVFYRDGPNIWGLREWQEANRQVS